MKCWRTSRELLFHESPQLERERLWITNVCERIKFNLPLQVSSDPNVLKIRQALISHSAFTF